MLNLPFDREGAARTGPLFDAGDVAYALRNYTIGFVIEEQAYLALVASGEWDDLVRELPRPGANESRRSSDAIAILSDDRDQRFRAGLETILTGTAA